MKTLMTNFTRKNYSHIFAMAVLAFSAFTIWNLSRLHSVSLEKLFWDDSAPVFIEVDNVPRDEKQAVLFIRLKDGKEQSVIGTWNVTFDRKNAFAYGNELNESMASSTATSTGPYLLDLNMNRIRIFTANKLKGEIRRAFESSNGSYVAVRVDSGSEHSYCLIETTSLPQKDCFLIDASNDDEVLWNPSNDHELVLKTATSSLATIDAWDGENGRRHYVTDQQDQKRFKELSALFDRETPKFRVIRFFGLTAVDAGRGWTLFQIPRTGNIALLDNNHLLVKEQDGLSIIEIGTRSIAKLSSLKDVGSKSIFYRHENDDPL